MLLSSGVIWRHRTLAEFRAECPGGDPALQRRIVEELDDALDWLESLGVAPVRARDRQPAHRRPPLRPARRSPRRSSARPATSGSRRRSRRRRSSPPAASAARLARERGLLLRASPWSEGDGLAYGLAPRRGAHAGAWTSTTAATCRRRWPRALRRRGAALRGARARARRRGSRPRRGSLARERPRPAAAGTAARWYVVDARALLLPVRERTVADLVEAARAAGGEVRPAEELPFELPRVAEARRAAVPRGPRPRSVTHTIGGFGSTIGPASSTRTGARSRRSTPRAPTRAGSSPAATAAASPPRSSTAASPPKPRSPERLRIGSGELRVARRGACRPGTARGRPC